MLCRGGFGGCIRNYVGGSGEGGGWRFQRGTQAFGEIDFPKNWTCISVGFIYFAVLYCLSCRSLSHFLTLYLSREEDLPTWMGEICLNSAGLDDVKCKDGRSKA